MEFFRLHVHVSAIYSDGKDCNAAPML